TVLHDDTGKFLAGLAVGYGLRAGAKLQTQRASENHRRQAVTEKDGNPVLVAGTELANYALVIRLVRQAHAQDGEAFGWADADVLDLQEGRHSRFLQQRQI